MLESGQPVSLEKYISAPGNRYERVVSRYGHLLGAGLNPAELAAWQERFPHHALPADLRAFLSQVNGVRLWADLATGWSYFRILPLEEWVDAMTHPIAYVFEEPLHHALCISDASDSAGFVVLETSKPTYWWCDSIDHPARIGSTVESLLAHWWADCRMDPRERAALVIDRRRPDEGPG